MSRHPERVPGPLVRKGIKYIEGRKLRGVLTSSGIEGIPSEGKTIFVSNHRNNKYDARALGIVIPREFYIPAKIELQDDGRLRTWAMRQCGALFFDRNDDQERRRVTQEMQYHLIHGAMIGIFSEGTSTAKGPKLKKLEDGAGVLAARNGAFVVPVGIGGTELEQGQHPRHIHVAAGEGFYVPPSEDRREWLPAARAVTARLQTEVQEMFDFAREQAAT